MNMLLRPGSNEALLLCRNCLIDFDTADGYEFESVVDLVPQVPLVHGYVALAGLTCGTEFLPCQKIAGTHDDV